MENKDAQQKLLKRTSLKMVILVTLSTIIGLGVFQIIHIMGWPDTVMWFFGSFAWIFIFLTGFLNIMNKITAS